MHETMRSNTEGRGDCELPHQMTSDRIYNVLFLCTGNSARSILAESLLSHLGVGRFRAFSAGSFPKGTVHTQAVDLLKQRGLPTQGLRSKSWDEFAKSGAPALDFIFTVCDNAAGEVCPIWPGKPTTAHWGIADPAAVEGTKPRRQPRSAKRYVSWKSAFSALSSYRSQHSTPWSSRRSWKRSAERVAGHDQTTVR
jgi:arsenate reductase (thioredoxin)